MFRLLIEVQNLYCKAQSSCENFASGITVPPLFERLQELHQQVDLKDTDAQLRRHRLHYYYLYQIIYLLVKGNPITKSMICRTDFTFIIISVDYESYRLL